MYKKMIIKEKMIEYYEFERKMMKAKGWPKIDFQGSFGQAYETYQPTTDEDDERGLDSDELQSIFESKWPKRKNQFSANLKT